MTATARAAEAAAQLALRDADRDALLRTARRADADAALGQQLETRITGLAALIGSVEVPVPESAWPGADPALQAGLDLLSVVLTVPATIDWYLARGLSIDEARENVQDITRKVDIYGVEATGIDWLIDLALARVVRVGRLQFEIGATDPRDGSPAWGVHIPEAGPLDPVTCDASFAAAPQMMARVFGDVTTQTFTCHSWLLDPNLAEFLPPESNILRFAARFDLLGDHADADQLEGDRAVAKFVFRRPLGELASMEPHSSLERGVLGRLTRGEHWAEREGVALIERG